MLKSVQRLSDEYGFDVTYLGLSKRMAPYPVDLSKSVTPNTGLVSIMNTNNEIGYAFDTHLIGKFCTRHGLLFHTDCVQAAGCRPINVKNIGCDFATISSHKIEGPKGVGALVVDGAVMKAKGLAALTLGGGQEGGLRSGTESVPLIAGLRGAIEELPKNNNKIIELRDYAAKHGISFTQPHAPFNFALADDKENQAYHPDR